MSISIRGYSERGILNSLLFEIRRQVDGLKYLLEFLNLTRFPNCPSPPDWQDIESAQIILEQSFSDFGDLDALILLQGKRKQAVFIEAKVKTAQRNQWLIEDEWSRFAQHISRTGDDQRRSSNLFVQLYRKQMLIRQIQGEVCHPDAVSSRWRIGANPVVLRAVDELRPYCDSDSAWFLCIVPDSDQNMNSFFAQPLRDDSKSSLPAWNCGTLGYLTWSRLEAWAQLYPGVLCDSLACFEFNREQIYADQNTPSQSYRAGVRIRYSVEGGTGLLGTVVRSGRHNTRVELDDGERRLVPTSQLTLFDPP